MTDNVPNLAFSLNFKTPAFYKQLHLFELNIVCKFKILICL